MIKYQSVGVTFIFLIFSVFPILSQSDDDLGKRYIKPNLLSITNYHSSLKSDSSAFQQEKLLLGVTYKINEHWSGRIWLDVIRYDDKQNPQRLTPFIKPGFIAYHNNKLTVETGVLFSTQFSDQLQRWGHRYLYKTFQDKQSFGWSNDLGIRVKYQALPKLTVISSVLNGAGFKNVGISLPLKYAGAVIYIPTENLFLKVYKDVYRKNVPQSSFATLIDYRKINKYSFSLEYNYERNFKFIPGQDRYGYSAYTTINFLDDFAVISRFDKLYIKDNEYDIRVNNKPTINSLFILGVQYQLIKQVRFAINYQLWEYYKDIKSEEPWLFINLEYRFI